MSVKEGLLIQVLFHFLITLLSGKAKDSEFPFYDVTDRPGKIVLVSLSLDQIKKVQALRISGDLALESCMSYEIVLYISILKTLICS